MWRVERVILCQGRPPCQATMWYGEPRLSHNLGCWTHECRYTGLCIQVLHRALPVQWPAFLLARLAVHGAVGCVLYPLAVWISLSSTAGQPCFPEGSIACTIFFLRLHRNCFSTLCWSMSPAQRHFRCVTGLACMGQPFSWGRWLYVKTTADAFAVCVRREGARKEVVDEPHELVVLGKREGLMWVALPDLQLPHVHALHVYACNMTRRQRKHGIVSFTRQSLAM